MVELLRRETGRGYLNAARRWHVPEAFPCCLRIQSDIEKLDETVSRPTHVRHQWPAILAGLFLSGLIVMACSSTGQFTKDGHQVDPLVAVARAGPAHCGWQSATFLTLGWPLGRRALFASEARQYINDPNGVVPHADLRGTLDLHAKLPPDAKPTGYWKGDAQLYLAPSDQDVAAYFVGGGHVERWPRADPMTVCS